MDKLRKLTAEIIKFRDERNWQQFHNPKDVALSLVLEATELLEHFQWKNNDEISNHVEKSSHEISEELADILYWVLLMSHDLKIDISSALENKLEKNKAKYPINMSKGNSIKYNKF
jgi:NTP pyrophosphatase (non-canonical NTP hydrolase)